MNARALLKWMHWASFALILYFFIVEPEENRADPGGTLSMHAGFGLLLGLVTAFWLWTFLRKGLIGRPGPKLPGWGKSFHRLSHHTLQIGLPFMVATGAFAGLAAPFLIKAFGVVPINFAGGTKTLHDLAEDIHEWAFDLLIIAIVLHALFHLWRHFGLKDNALRVILPNALHRFL